jgi:hypothetical protein
MKLTEALSGSLLAGPERGAGGCWSIIHRSRGGFHLTRYTPDDEDRPQAQTWLFPNLYDLLLFARSQGFSQVDPEATDWRMAERGPVESGNSAMAIPRAAPRLKRSTSCTTHPAWVIWASIS